MTAVPVDRAQHGRRFRQRQLRGFGEKFCDSIELPVIDTCGVPVY
jgi:hypothetical protein